MASVVVVGGGVAGLACAWRLRRAGHEVEVLERESAPGGRMRSESHGEFRVERGAQFVASSYRNLRATADALGVGQRIRPLACTAQAFLRDGRLHRWDLETPWRLASSGLLGARAKWRLPRLAFEIARRRRLDPLRPETALALDGEDLAHALRRWVGAEATEYWLGPTFAATFDAEPETLSAAFGLVVLRQFAGASLQAFDGGNGAFTSALAAQVPVRTGCDVFDVETATDGARVRYRCEGSERKVWADAAVVALPASEAAAVCSKLTPAERGFFSGLRAVRGIIVHLLLERPLPGLPFHGVAFPRSAGLDVYGLGVDHHRPDALPAGAGLVNVALTESAAARLWSEPDAAVEQCVLESLGRTPIGRPKPLGSIVHRHAPLVPRFRPGSFTRLRDFHERLDRSPRLAFAGDYLLGATAEAALTSGQRAAGEVVRSLG